MPMAVATTISEWIRLLGNLLLLLPLFLTQCWEFTAMEVDSAVIVFRWYMQSSVAAEQNQCRSIKCWQNKPKQWNNLVCCPSKERLLFANDEGIYLAKTIVSSMTFVSTFGNTRFFSTHHFHMYHNTFVRIVHGYSGTHHQQILLPAYLTLLKTSFVTTPVIKLQSHTTLWGMPLMTCLLVRTLMASILPRLVTPSTCINLGRPSVSG